LPLVRALRKRSCREKQLKIADAACGGVANIRLGGKGSGRSFSNRLKARSSVCPPPHCCSECPVRVHASVGGKRTCRRRPETRSERPGDAPQMGHRRAPPRPAERQARGAVEEDASPPPLPKASIQWPLRTRPIPRRSGF